jgi:large subunit ribosomal protein L22
MEVKAVEKYIRISPKKARLVANIVRGQNAKKALVTLKFTPKKAAKIIHKAVKSAVANAENNFNAEGEKLIIKSISVDGGPSLKRIQPVSKGMAHSILKRTSHITVVVSDETTTIKSKKLKLEAKKAKKTKSEKFKPAKDVEKNDTKKVENKVENKQSKKSEKK